MTRETELAWAAGFFDGEGCVTNRPTARDRCPVPKIQVGQSDDEGVPETLVRFERAVGVPCRIYGPFKQAGRRDKYTLSIGKWADVQTARGRLWPYLSGPKRRAFEVAFMAYEAKRADPLPNGKPWTHCKAGHRLTPDNIYTARNGSRRCKTCSKENARKQRDLRRASTGGS